MGAPLLALRGICKRFGASHALSGVDFSLQSGEIDVLSWSWGLSQSGTMHTGGGGGSGKVNVQDLTLTKWVDKASPVLMQYAMTGNQFPTA